MIPFWETHIPMPPTFGLNAQDAFKKITLFAHMHGVSDIFIQADQPIILSKHGKLFAVTRKMLDPIEVWNILYLLTERHTAKTDLLSGIAVNASYVLQTADAQAPSGIQRYYYRVNATAIQNSKGIDTAQIVMRAIPYDPPTIEAINLPLNLLPYLTPKQGIVYVAGATGSGKSTTFAAIIRYILENDTPIQGNIITYEAPIEFRFGHITSAHSIITQSEVPRHVASFYDGIKEAMRRKPELILIGELRDEETIQAATEAAITGHAVFATVHANSVPNILLRLLYRLPESSRSQGIANLLDASRVLIAQKLLPAIDGGRVPIREFLVITPPLVDAVLKEKNIQNMTAILKSFLQTEGQTFAQDAHKLLQANKITEKTYALCLAE